MTRGHRKPAARLLLAAAMVLGVLNLSSQPSQAVQFCNTTTIVGVVTNGPATPYPSSITVSGLTGTVTDVNVSILDFTTFPDTGGFHWAEDTDLLVSAPNGANVTLMSDAGGDNDTSSGPVNAADITFDTQAANQLPADSLLTSGTFRPVDDDDDVAEQIPNNVDTWPAPAPAPSGSTSLNTFNGIGPNGTWNLWSVEDMNQGHNDIVGGWCIDILTTGGSTSTSTSSTTSTSTTSTSTTSTTIATTTTTSTTSTTVPPTTTTSTTAPPVTCDGRRATIVGTGGHDSLVGTPGPDVIAGGGGNDSIQGLGGEDVICGGPGTDRLAGGEGNDRLFGDAGTDQLLGENGNDALFGGSGVDRLFGGAGNDAMNGGADTDECSGDAGTDSASACEGVLGVP